MYKNDGVTRCYSEWFKLKILSKLSTGGYIKITTEDKPQNLILLSNIDDEYVKQIKMTIKKIAESKNIELIWDNFK